MKKKVLVIVILVSIFLVIGFCTWSAHRDAQYLLAFEMKVIEYARIINAGHDFYLIITATIHYANGDSYTLSSHDAGMWVFSGELGEKFESSQVQGSRIDEITYEITITDETLIVLDELNSAIESLKQEERIVETEEGLVFFDINNQPYTSYSDLSHPLTVQDIETNSVGVWWLSANRLVNQVIENQRAADAND